MFLPHYTEIAGEHTTPSQWMVVMHGIYGRGANWRSFARKLCQQKTSWGILLCDLRMHGQSQSAPAPHTLQACAQDMLALVEHEESEGRRISAVLGHSFGGKVALEMRRLRATLPALWLIDSSPSSRPGAMEDAGNTVVQVLRVLETLPQNFVTRDAFVSELISKGLTKSLGLWLAMNLEVSGAGYRMTLQSAAMRELLSDYFARDLWSAFESAGPPIHLACASESSALSQVDLTRLRRLALSGSVFVHPVKGSHWLHVDALEDIVALVATHLS